MKETAEERQPAAVVETVGICQTFAVLCTCLYSPVLSVRGVRAPPLPGNAFPNQTRGFPC